MNTKQSALPDPPSVLNAIRNGYDAITNHISLVLFPVALDLLLWFAPRLRVKMLIEGLIIEMNSVSSLLSGDFEEMLQASQEIWMDAAGRINLVAALRSFPVGVFSLLASILPTANPLGEPFFFEITQFQHVIILVILFFILGIVVGGLYFSAVRQAVLFDEIRWPLVFRQWPRRSAQALLLSLILVTVVLALLIFGSCVATGFAFFNVTIGQAVVLLIGIVAFWLVFPLFFSPHGIFVKNLKAGKSMVESIRLTNLTFFRSGFFIMIALLITQGLDVLWRVPPEDSWMMLISILGHGFVTTGMLAASFVYYQEMDRWVSELFFIQKAKQALGEQTSEKIHRSDFE